MLEDKVIWLKLEGECAEIKCEVDPKHKENVSVENGVKVIYL